MPKKKDETFNFETAIEGLNDIVENMEQGDLSLEESLKQFEQGIKLTRQCQKALTDAEQKVQILMEQNSDQSLTDYEEDEG